MEWDRLLLRVREVPRSAEQSVINEAKTNKAPQSTAVYIDYTWDVCTICLKGVGNGADDKQILDCGHHFHSGCISKWQGSCKSEDVSCPNCRRVSKLLASADPLEITRSYFRSGETLVVSIWRIVHVKAIPLSS